MFNIDKIKQLFKKHKKVLFIFSLIIGIFIWRIISTGIYIPSLYRITINNNSFYIGDKLSTFERKGYTYLDDYTTKDSKIISNGIMPHTIYKDGEAVMYVALRCDKKVNCSYSEAKVIKINFYSNLADLVVGDTITIGTSYDSIVKQFGEQDGKFYMSSDEYVWAVEEKGEIDNPYYIFEFDKDKKVKGIKVGVWWYEGEYEHSIKK